MFLCVVLFWSTTLTFAIDVNNIPKADLKKLRDYISSKKSCAIASIYLPKYNQLNEYLTRPITCIQRLVFNEGAINEKSGCGYWYFDPFKPTNQYQAKYWVGSPLSLDRSMLVGQDCNSSSINQLAKIEIDSAGKWKGIDFMFSPWLYEKNYEEVLIYWENDSLKNAYLKLRKEYYEKQERITKEEDVISAEKKAKEDIVKAKVEVENKKKSEKSEKLNKKSREMYE